MPHTNHRRAGTIVIAAGIAIIVSFVFAAERSSTRRASVDQALATQRVEDRHLCAAIQTVDHILTVQLRGALVRLNASVDRSSSVWRQQHALLVGGIDALAKHKCKE